VLTGREMKNVKNLLTALERPDLIEMCATDDCLAQEPVKEFLRETFQTKTLDDWLAWLADKDVGHAPVLTLPEALEQPQVAEREMLIQENDTVRHMGLPLKFSEEPGHVDFHVPKLNENADELLTGLGYSEQEIVKFRSDGVFG